MKINGILKKISETFGRTGDVIGDTPEMEIEKADTALTIPPDELKMIYPNIFTSSDDKTTLTENDLITFMKPIHDSLSAKKRDYDKLCEIAPEIKNASSILIPSILSPNSLQPISEITITIPYDGITEELRKKIIKTLSYHFNNELKLHEKLGGWIETALIKEGSKPLMIIPPHVIKRLKNADISNSNESLSSIINSLSSTPIYTRKLSKRNDSYSSECISKIDFNELSKSISDDIKDEIEESLKEMKYKNLSVKKEIVRLSSEEIKNVVKEAKPEKYISVIDNLEILVMKNYKRKKGVAIVNNEFDSFYNKNENLIENMKKESLVDISILLSSTPEKDDFYPIIEELPPESIIPIITKSNPEDHLAYLIILDENGSPINSDDYDDLYWEDENSISVDKLYATMRGSNNSGLLLNNTRILQSSYGNIIKRKAVNKILDTYIDISIRKNIEDIGITDFDIKLNETIMGTMFKRILKRKQTNILFVPKSIVFYLAFDYNKDGTGRSKLENIKFPLSLKMTFMITKLMALIEASTNKKRVEVQLDENKGINHLEILRAIKNKFIQNKLGGLSHDPSTIMRSIVDRQVSILPRNIPGVSSFEIKEESAPRSLPRPETELFEEINNMYILGLDVPPSTLNQLGENEFSRSIATFNFFFSNKIMKYQSIICNELSDLLSCYIKYSVALRNAIVSILTNDDAKIENKEGDPKPEKIDIDESKAKNDEEIRKILNYIISSIRVTLSSPKIVYDKAQYEEIKNYTEIINGLVDSLYPEEMIEDSDLTDSFKVFKAYIKADLINKYLNDISAFSHFNIDSLNEINFLKISNTKMSIANLNKLLKDIKNKVMDGQSFGGETEEPESEETQW